MAFAADHYQPTRNDPCSAIANAPLADRDGFQEGVAMKLSRAMSIAAGVWTLMFMLLAVTGLPAQTRIVLPEGTVIVVRTSSPLESATAKAGQTFETVVVDTVRVE